MSFQDNMCNGDCSSMRLYYLRYVFATGIVVEFRAQLPFAHSGSEFIACVNRGCIVERTDDDPFLLASISEPNSTRD